MLNKDDSDRYTLFGVASYHTNAECTLGISAVIQSISSLHSASNMNLSQMYTEDTPDSFCKSNFYQRVVFQSYQKINYENITTASELILLPLPISSIQQD